MAQGKYVAYYRVSTTKQGRSGLGLQAQKTAVTNYLNGGRWDLVREFVEVETGKGRDALHRRPKLREALDVCKAQRATLLVAKLDRLARNVHFLSGLQESGVKFVAVDMPDVNEFTLHVLAAVAQQEAKAISERTKAALAAAKARGTKLGNAGRRNLRRVSKAAMRHPYAQEHAERVRVVLSALTKDGRTQREIADELNRLGIKSARGGMWHLATVQRVFARLA